MAIADLWRAHARLEQVAQPLVNPHRVFHIPTIDQSAVGGELGSLRLTSWLYTVYVENDRASIRFLLERATTEAHYEHIQTVSDLRTSMQHDIGGDTLLNARLSRWYQVTYGQKPGSDGDWNRVYERILDGAIHLYGDLVAIASQISADSQRDRLCRLWRKRLSAILGAREWDDILDAVAQSLNIRISDFGTFRQVGLRRWQYYLEQLQAFDPGVEPAILARRIVEYDVLFRLTDLLPMTGEELIDQYPIRLGEELSRKMRCAQLVARRFGHNVFRQEFERRCMPATAARPT